MLNRAKPHIVVIVSLSVIVGGCQTGSQFAKSVGAAPLARDDACRSYSRKLRNSRGYFDRSLIKGVLIGAAGGAFLGAVAGGKNRGKGAFIGAIAGAASGLALGYYSAKQKHYTDRAKLVGSINQDVQAESAEIARALVAFQKARSCRLGVARDIKRSARSGTITRAIALKKLSIERQRFGDDVLVVQAIGANVAKRQKELEGATVQISQNSSNARGLLAAGRENTRNWSTPNGRTPRSFGANTMQATSNLNVRSGPSIGHARIGRIEGGNFTELLETTADGNWTQVKLDNGKTGYVASRYLTKYKPKKTTPTNPWEVPALTPPIDSNTDAETKTVAALYEGVEKRLEMERLTKVAEEEEKTSFKLL